MGHGLVPINPPQWALLAGVWLDKRQSAASSDVCSTWKQWSGRTRCKSNAACPTQDILFWRACRTGPPTSGGGKMKPWTNNGRHLRTALEFMSGPLQQASPSVLVPRRAVGEYNWGLKNASPLVLSPAICQATHRSHKLPSAGTHLIRRRSVNEALRGTADNGVSGEDEESTVGRLQYVKRAGTGLISSRRTGGEAGSSDGFYWYKNFLRIGKELRRTREVSNSHLHRIRSTLTNHDVRGEPSAKLH